MAFGINANSGFGGSVEKPVIAITPRTTLIQSGGTCWDPICGSNRSICRLLVLDSNNWCEISV